MTRLRISTSIILIFPLLGVFSSCQVTNKNLLESELLPYKLAYSFLVNNHQVFTENADPQNIRVKNEILRFENYTHYFRDDLMKNSGLFSSEEMLFDSLVVKVDSRLGRMGSVKGAKSILFFSEVKKDFFFAELLLNLSKTRFAFAARPNFGESYAFLFKRQGKEIMLVRARKLFYN